MKKQLTPEEIEELKKRHIRSFQPRRGHISNAQERALDEIFPRFELVYEKDKPIDPRLLFGRTAPLVLEIGCGMGETTAAIAKARPEVDFLGCEVFSAGVGALSKLIDAEHLTNIRIAKHDAVEIVRDMVKNETLDGVHIFFPDPWRKTRHHKRRLIQPSFLQLLVPKIKHGGYIHLTTDWENYAEWMLEVLSGNADLVNTAPGFAENSVNPLCERPRTKFQARGEKLGYGIWDLIFKRR